MTIGYTIRKQQGRNSAHPVFLPYPNTCFETVHSNLPTSERNKVKQRGGIQQEKGNRMALSFHVPNPTHLISLHPQVLSKANIKDRLVQACPTQWFPKSVSHSLGVQLRVFRRVPFRSKRKAKVEVERVGLWTQIFL